MQCICIAREQPILKVDVLEIGRHRDLSVFDKGQLVMAEQLHIGCF